MTPLRTALTWVTDEALLGFTGVGEPIAAHVATARTLGVDIVFVDAGAPDSLERAAALAGSGRRVAWAVPGPLSRVERESGFSETLMATAREPGALAFRLDEALHEALDDVRRGVQAAAELFVVADDVASGGGWLVSPDFALEVLMRTYRRLASEISASSGAAIFHSDGDVRALYPALAHAGFAGVHIAGVDHIAVGVMAAAASDAGLLSMGGVAAVELARCGVAEIVELITSSSARPAIICDDGGIADAAGLATYSDVLAALQDTSSPEEGGRR